MNYIDWIILSSTLLFIVIYGTLKSKGSKNVEEYILADQNTNWWTVGLSVMATQASAITFLSTPGQAFHDGLGFVQFYFGLPLAMIVICIAFIPVYHRLKVYTAYEFLENRFDLKTRTLAAVIFLIQRSVGTGLTIYAPSIILSSILGWNLTYITITIGILIIIYTYFGGTKALNVTQKQQAFVIMFGMFITFLLIIYKFPTEITFSNSLDIASINGKMDILNFSTDPSEKYTVWSGITGGFFLMLAYFGTDQSQVGRYLSGKSIKEIQMGLIMNGALKVPMQFFILLVGVMVFIFFQFNKSPLHFNPNNTRMIENSAYKTQYQELENELDVVLEEKNEITLLYSGQLNQDYDNPILEEKMINLNEKEREIRKQGSELIKKANPSAETNDKDYVFIYFILNYLPHGLIGLLLAVIFSAAMSSSASGLYAIASASAMDLYRSHVKDKTDEQYLKVTKYSVIFWGIVCILTACVINLFENLIQLVNIIGSIFYGTVLGIFLVALFVKYVKAKAIFWTGLFVQISVIYIFLLDIVGYLWLNLIGTLGVILLSIIVQFFINMNSEKKMN
ncbi:sodium:solute symporter [Paenimyroides tangerinum]|uniref:Sodium:solute symporter n=1 Tax=Paenimyroides tangerinum TaxID=2488728 RepID=A0A3P3W1W6_9FLAO|nr:sodium:solute symporter [Paenimyroides tangerinum]RRJ88507.1 sodium:solute symporter [Paenimyroides tangerinum]